MAPFKSSLAQANKFMRRKLTALFFTLFLLSTVWCQESKWQPAAGPLKTRWAKDVSPAKVLPDYPRPQLVRKDWMNLNGLWELSITNRDVAKPDSFPEQVLVPFPVESALSGVMKIPDENQQIWYRRSFS